MNIEIKNLRNHEFHNEPWQFRVDRGTPRRQSLLYARRERARQGV